MHSCSHPAEKLTRKESKTRFSRSSYLAHLYGSCPYSHQHMMKHDVQAASHRLMCIRVYT